MTKTFSKTVEPEPIKPVEVKLYSLDDIKELLKASKANYTEGSIKVYTREFKKVLKETLDMEEPYDFSILETRHIQFLNKMEQYQPKDKSRYIIIILKIVRLIPGFDEDIASTFGEKAGEFNSASYPTTVLQPATEKQIKSFITHQDLEKVRNKLYEKIIVEKKYDSDAIAFICASILMNFSGLRPDEIVNSTFTKQDNKNFLDFENKIWKFDKHKCIKKIKNRQDALNDSLIEDLKLIQSLHHQDMLIPQQTNLEQMMLPAKLLETIQPIFKRITGIHFTFRGSRTALISQDTPDMTVEEKDKYARMKCGHSLTTQQFIYKKPTNKINNSLTI